jgi:glycosyltransferase-like protein
VLERGQFDMLHAHDSLNGNALATLRARDRHVPAWVRTVHHLDDFAHPQLAAWQARAWRAADAIAAVSDTWVDRLRSEAGVSAERMFNGVNLARFGIDDAPGDVAALAAWGWREPSGPLCLAVGGIEARKNSVRLLQAFARLRRADPAWSDAQLLMIGGASLLDHGSTVRAWQETLAALGWAEGPDQPVWRAGPVPDAVMPALMRRATLLAMPSLVEGFGLVALEALACGTPVLVSRRAPFTEHLPGCEQVAWCDPEDEASIAAGLQQAARLPRAQATPAVCGRHAWSRSALLHEAWYRRVLADRPRRALPAAALLSL